MNDAAEEKAPQETQKTATGSSVLADVLFIIAVLTVEVLSIAAGMTATHIVFDNAVQRFEGGQSFIPMGLTYGQYLISGAVLFFPLGILLLAIIELRSGTGSRMGSSAPKLLGNAVGVVLVIIGLCFTLSFLPYVSFHDTARHTVTKSTVIKPGDQVGLTAQEKICLDEECHSVGKATKPAVIELAMSLGLKSDNSCRTLDRSKDAIKICMEDGVVKMEPVVREKEKQANPIFQ